MFLHTVRCHLVALCAFDVSLIFFKSLATPYIACSLHRRIKWSERDCASSQVFSLDSSRSIMLFPRNRTKNVSPVNNAPIYMDIVFYISSNCLNSHAAFLQVIPCFNVSSGSIRLPLIKC